MNKAARFARRVLPGLAVVALAVPAQAQVASASYQSMSKTEAILGGAPSALAAITSQQGSRPLYSSYVVPASRGPVMRPAVATYYTQGADGYIDYPVFADSDPAMMQDADLPVNPIVL